MKHALSTLAAFFAAAFCLAQMDMSIMVTMTGKPIVLMNRADVRKELKLSKDQQKGVAEIEKEYNTSAMHEPSGNDPSQLMAGMNQMNVVNEESDKVVALLDDGQKKRLFEIRVQAMGPPSITDPEVAKALGVSDDQVGKAKDILSAYFNELPSLMRSPGRGTKDKMAKARDANDAKILAVLTDDQKAKFKEIQGAPFKNARLPGFF